MPWAMIMGYMPSTKLVALAQPPYTIQHSMAPLKALDTPASAMVLRMPIFRKRKRQTMVPVMYMMDMDERIQPNCKPLKCST